MARKATVIDPDDTDTEAVEQSPEDLKAQIRALQAQLRKQGGDDDDTVGADSQPPPGMVRLSDLVDVMSQSMARIAPRRSKSMGEYEPNSPFQEGLKKKELPKLTRGCFENGNAIREHTTTPTEIRLLNQIVRPGRYIDRLVEVIVRDGQGPDDPGEMILRYSNKRDNMDLIRQHARNFKEMLTLILIEQAAALEKEAR